MNKAHPVVWWVGWIVLTILAFFVSCYFWTGIIARNVGTMNEPWAPVLWVSAVFGSWMVLLVPLIVVMYQKVDKAYEDARIRREKEAAHHRAEWASRTKAKTIFIEESRRVLPPALSRKLKKEPQIIRGGHLVHAILRDGRKIENVFIRDRKEVLGVYDMENLTFAACDIVDLELVPVKHPPVFREDRWLRLDGAEAV